MTTGDQLPDGRLLVSVPSSLGVIMDLRVVLPSRDMDLLVFGQRPPGARPSTIMVTARTGRLAGVRSAQRVPAWDLPVSAGRPIALPEGAWAVAKPGDLAPWEGPMPEPKPIIYHIASRKNPHETALEAIRSFLWGTRIREISLKKPWGFHASIKLENLALTEYLDRPHSYVDTTILHILSGEGAEIKLVQLAVQKASMESFRVLVLEHNPDAPDWVGNPSVSEDRLSAVRQAMSSFVTMESRIGGRNLILKHDSIPLLDLGRSTRSNVTGGFYSMTSEDYRRTDLFTASNAETLNHVDGSKTYHTVVGGMMFLDGLVQMNPRPIHLFDISIPQLAYLLATLDLIGQSRNREHFEALRSNPSFTKGMKERLGTMYDARKIIETLASTADSQSGDGYQNRWKNVLRKGTWLDHFHETKRKLSMINGISHVDIRELRPEAGDIVYASTIEGPLANLSDCYVVRCLNPRDTPCINHPTVVGGRKMVGEKIFLKLDDGLRSVISSQNSRAEDIERRTACDVRDMLPFLSKKPSQVLDLGCGSGRLSVGLFKTFPEWNAKFWLADGDCGDAPLRGSWDIYFDKEPRFYNKRIATERLCELNGLTNFEYITIGSDMNWSTYPERIDLMFSNRSIGYHFMIKIYEGVYPRILAPGALCIFVVREDAPQLSDLPPGFEVLDRTISTYMQCVLLITRYNPVD